MDIDSLVKLFSSIGLDEAKAKETTKNKKLTSALEQVIQEAGIIKLPSPTIIESPSSPENLSSSPCSLQNQLNSRVEGGLLVEKQRGLLLYLLAATCTDADALRHRPLLATKIRRGQLKSEDQVRAAISFVSKLIPGKVLDEAALDAECGVGINVSQDVIDEAVREAIAKHQELIGSREAIGTMLKDLKNNSELRWADRKAVKDTLDAAISAFKPSPSNGNSPQAPLKKASQPSSPGTTSGSDASGRNINGSHVRIFSGDVLKLHKPGENKQLTDEIMRKHLEATGGKVVTRFPPEPNGFPHIGHAKAMNFSFRYAEAHGGICYLRYDDTNPEAEEPRYYEALAEAVKWLGFEPYRVTAASDYFPQLYEFAVQLIKKGKAYVCHMTPEEIKASRGGDDMLGPRYDSPWRNRPIQENLAEFERMRRGEYQEGKAILRLKQDMHSANPFMWDLVAYRILYHPHCRTGTQWCIYPMYDFTHCLCDSLENITHSLCTTEFIPAREAYYWVLDQLEVYKAVQWEYGRLNITHTVTSKRKVAALVKEGHVSGWDDPRLFTLAALRRRGFPPAAINRFVEDIGITMAPTTTDVRKLEAFVRDELNKTSLRRMAVHESLRLVIENFGEFEDAGQLQICLPNDPRDPSKGDSHLTLTPRIYIDRSDFKAEGPQDNPSACDPQYYRLTPGQPVGLFRVGVFTMSRHVDGIVYGTLDRSESAPKPKAFIQWLPEGSPRATLRLYSNLFMSPNPSDNPRGWLADINPESLKEVKDAMVDPRLLQSDVKPEQVFQFQRLGYFCVDNVDGPLVFNLTVSIKEDPRKQQ